MSYNSKSMHAEEFIDDAEILECIDYAKKNKSNREVVDAILEKGKNSQREFHTKRLQSLWNAIYLSAMRR